MDRSLQSLLTSSGAVSTEAEKSLSEIAKAVVVDRPGEDKKSVREKAGLLALLNLLGIVDAFYSETAAEKEAPAADVAPPSAPNPTESLPSPLSALAKLISSASPPQPTPADSQASPVGTSSPPTGSALSNLLANVDPAILASMLGLVSGLAKARLPRPPTAAEETSQPLDGAGKSETAQEAGAAEVPCPQESGPAVPRPATEPGAKAPDQAGLGQASPPSPLQQILGIDPKVLTLVLNLLAELMKARPQEQRSIEQGKGKEVRTGETTTSVQDSSAAPALGVRKTPLGPRLYHKPGLGIYRSSHPAKAHPGNASGT